MKTCILINFLVHLYIMIVPKFTLKYVLLQWEEKCREIKYFFIPQLQVFKRTVSTYCMGYLHDKERV